METSPYYAFRGNRALTLLAVGEALSSMADWLLAVVLTVVVYRVTRSGTAVSLVTFTRLAPYALVLPWSGLVLDRGDRRLLMAGAGLGRALCMVGLVFAQSRATLLLVFPLIFASASLSCLLRPMVNASLPDLVEEQGIVAANSAVSQMDGTAHVAGPALAGVFVAQHAEQPALLITASAFAFSGLVLGLLPSPVRQLDARAGLELTFGEVFAGFRFLFRENERVLIALTATAAGLALVAGAYYVLAIVLCTSAFHLEGQGVGWLDAVYGAGGLTGGMLVVLAVRGRRVARLFVAGAALHCIAVLGLAVSPPGLLPFVCIAVAGIAAMVVQVTSTTILQAGAPREMLARAFTAFEAGLVAAMLVGAISAGPLVRLIGPRLATFLFALAGALLLCLSIPLLRRLEAVLGVRIFLRGVPFLAGLSRALLDDLAPEFEALDYPSGAVVVREGAPGDRLYIIRSGEVEVSVGGRVVRRLGPAGYFGEVALLHPVPRTATVRARTLVTVYSLGRSAFQDLLGQVEDLGPRLTSEARARYLYSPAVPLLPH